MKRLLLLSIFSLLLSSYILAFQPERITVIDDFELMSLPMGTDPQGINVGFSTFQGSATINLSLTDAPPVPVPDSDPGNRVICAEMNVGSFAGYIHNFTNGAVDTWIPMDWSTYEGIRLWVHGSNTGTSLFLDIIENRNLIPSGDDAERWTVEFIDDFTGWQLFQFPWEVFTRKPIGNGAPDDGLSLTEVHGYAFGSLTTPGLTNFYIDSVAIYGEREVIIPLLGQFASSQYQVEEGSVAQIEVVMNATSMDPVTFTYATAEGTAIPNRDYVPAMGEVIILPGTTTASFPITTIDNNKSDGDRSVMIDIKQIDGADPGFPLKTRLTIMDDEGENVGLIDDFEGCHPFQESGSVTAESIELFIEDEMALPCQGDYENVLRTSGSGILSRTFSEPQDWSDSTGLSFWFYGTGSGETITVDLLDNQSNNTSNTMPDEWVMVWSDEFDDDSGTPPNPNIWKHEIGDGGLNGILGWGNEELQYYTDDLENASTDGDGNMVIRMLEVNTNNSDLICWYGPCEYTSARLNTKDKLDFQYGRIEARILVPDGGAGLWPAFWTLGSDIDEVGWPTTGEIDIMEYVSRVPNEIFGTIHGPGYAGGASFGNTYDFGSPVSDSYHTFAIEWIENEINWYVDDILYHSAIPLDVGSNDWVFNKPFHLLLNMAIGGNFGGTVDNGITFPQELLIDYVRVYQAENSSERFEFSFTDHTEGWRLVYLPFLGFSRSSNQPGGAPNDGLGLNEIWGYEINLPEAQTNNGGFLIDEIRLSDGLPEPPCFIPPIPTLTDWGVVILMFALLILGVGYLRNRKERVLVLNN